MINVVIPMAGLGKRFKDGNYNTPKPFIEILGKPLIQWSLDSLKFKDAKYIFIVRKEHVVEYKREFDKIKDYIFDSEFIEIDTTTEGQASSVYLAKNLINNDNPLFVANCDQYVDWDIQSFEKNMECDNDGTIITFNSNDSAYSYAKLNTQGYVCETAEKKPISENATVGFYFWKKGKVFIESYEQMYRKNIRVNNEFYVCPVYNETIELGYKNITIFPCNKMWSLGTPDDLKNFQNKNRDQK